MTDDREQRDTIPTGIIVGVSLPDPRILDFVLLIARAAAETDYSAAFKGHGPTSYLNED